MQAFCVKNFVLFPFKPGVYAYVTLKDHVTEPEEQIVRELKDIVRKNIAAYAVPEMIQVSWAFPRIFSGRRQKS